MKQKTTDRNDQKAIDRLQKSVAMNGPLVDSSMIDRLPCQDAIENLCDQLFESAFYPFEDRDDHDSRIRSLTETVKSVGDLLQEQIARALEIDGTPLDSVGKLADVHTRDFLGRLGDLRDMLIEDVDSAFEADPACKGRIEIVLAYPGIRAIAIYRFAHELYRQKVPLLPRMMAEFAHSKTGIDIHPGAIIGKRFFIDHGTGVVIGETAQIGDGVRIFQGVTLGAISFERDENGNIIRGLKRHPTLEDNVVVYAGATILGGRTTIGHDSVIGSNVWLTKSVGPGTTVIMERPKLRMRSSGDDEFSGSAHFQI